MTESNIKNEEDKRYIDSIITKFNANKDDQTLSVSEKTLLNKILETENNIADANKEMVELKAKLSHLQSQALAFIDAIICLRPGTQEGEKVESK